MTRFTTASGDELGAEPGTALHRRLTQHPDWQSDDQPAVETPNEEETVDPAGSDLDGKSREELNEVAEMLGISEPDKMPNKDAVKDAIVVARDEASAGE